MKIAALITLLSIGVSVKSQQTCDILIQNARIVDGSGNPWYRGSIAISNGSIVDIGRSVSFQGKRVIDARNMIVAPGFIDVHTHIEGDEAKEPLAKSFIYDGVTTCVTGNCGSSRVNIAEYLNYIDSLKLSVNVAVLLGHNDVRKEVMGRANRHASSSELEKMKQLVEKGMQEGAVGLSTGLIYIPGTYAPSEEIVELARIAGRYKGVYASHMRNEGDSVVPAIREALHIGREAGLPVEISHFKVSGQQNWGRSSETLALIQEARAEGLDVTIDQYPYTASSTSISTLLPDELLADGQDSIVARLNRPDIRKYAIDFMLGRLKKRKLKHFSYAVVANHAADTSFNGKSIEQINLMKGRKHKARYEAETILDIQSAGGAGAVFHGMSEDDLQYFLRYPFNMFASDASIRQFNVGVPHPRGYGTNARVLARYVREQKIIGLEEAIRRMTSLPAQKFSLRNRGLLQPGFAADIVVFDPDKVQDLSVFEKPHAYSVGFEYVMVNGVVTVEQGKHIGTRAGQTLRHQVSDSVIP